MFSGLAPGKPAPTDMVGKSTCGRGDTGNRRKATAPDKKMAMTRSVVATGRRINGSEKFIGKRISNGKGSREAGARLIWCYICHLKSPYGFVVLALPFVVATAFDNIARDWFDSSRIAGDRLRGTISALASNRSQ
jgi:hypothetical protein